MNFGMGAMKRLRYIATSVADPHHFDADPDPAFHFDADPDPDADPTVN